MDLITFKLKSERLPNGIRDIVCIQGRLTTGSIWSGTLLPNDLAILSCAWDDWITRAGTSITHGWHLCGPTRELHEYDASSHLSLLVVLVEPVWLHRILGMNVADLTDQRESVGCTLAGARCSLALDDPTNCRDVSRLIGRLASVFSTAGFDSTDTARNIGDRQRQRRHRSSTGMDRRKYRTVSRFQKAISHLNRVEPLSLIAQEQGYADQSHFCRECRIYSGRSPVNLQSAMAASPVATMNREVLRLSRVISY
jgi:AraC-like DNA-binding protein